ncbi:MAG: PQQ-binding-like beta-propeller repeat protein [Cellulomonas sp.]
MGREEMRAVELADEASGAPDAGTTGSGPTTRPADDRRWVGRRRGVIAVAATLVVGLLSTQAVLDARERTRTAHLASVPGIVAPVDASIGALWSSSDMPTLFALGGAAWGDATIGGYLDERGERTVRAVRPRTGEVVWSTVLSAADPAAQARGSTSSPSCTIDERTTNPQVVCLVSDSGLLGNVDLPPTPVAATFVRLLVLDPATGNILTQHDEPTTSAAWVGMLDGLAVVASRGETGHLVVVGEDPRTAEVRWRFESPSPLADPLPTSWANDPSGLTVGVVGDRVTVSASGGEVWVLSADGDVVDQEPAGDRTGVEVPRPGLIAVVDYDMSSPTGRSMRIVGRDMPLGKAADKQPVHLSVDDGSVPNLLFTTSGGLVAWDMTTWGKAWSSDVAGDTSAILLDGRLYTTRPDGHVVAVDASTGATLWEAPVVARSVLTDGRSILIFTTLATGAHTLVAVAPDDGHRLWEVSLADSITDVWPIGRRLVGLPGDSGPAVVLG